LEIARAVARQGSRPVAGEPLPVPEDLQQLLRARVADLPRAAGPVLLAVAAASRPTEELVVAAAGTGDRAVESLSAGERSGVIERANGRIRFSHPLLASTVYGAASPRELRTLHERLAALVGDPEERARHLALATRGADAAVAERLDDAARHSRARGAPDAAAELAELAAQLSPTDDPQARSRRNLEAAEHHFDAGDAGRAIALLEETIASSPPGPGRAETLYRLASMRWMNLERGVRAPLEQALSEVGDDPGLLAGINLDLAWVDIYRGRRSAAWEHAKQSLGFAERISDAGTRSDSLATFGMVEFLAGRDAEELMTKAIALQDEWMSEGSWTQGSVYTTPRSIYGLQLMWAGKLGDARAQFEHELAEYDRHAMYTVRQEVLCYLAELECRAGRWPLATEYADAAMETVAESGQAATQTHVVRFNQALPAVYLGNVEAARTLATEGMELADSIDDTFNGCWNRAVLGLLELSRSNFEEAHAFLEPVVTFLAEMSPSEPGVIPCVPDDIEALISLGRTDEAAALLERLEEQARSRDRPWARATSLRCRALLLASAGDLEAARAALEDAVEEHLRVPQPLELGRTLMVRGEVERRSKQKRAAGLFLRRALGIFDELGAALWAARARMELERLGGTVAAPTELTPTEQRVAKLITEGRTNREVADALFVSVKTVEANLTRIFRKLGIRSRAELIRRGAVEASAADTPGSTSVPSRGSQADA
jgi:DNA-binding CsgD family transcriptional regulator